MRRWVLAFTMLAAILLDAEPAAARQTTAPPAAGQALDRAGAPDGYLSRLTAGRVTVEPIPIMDGEYAQVSIELMLSPEISDPFAFKRAPQRIAGNVQQNTFLAVGEARFTWDRMEIVDRSADLMTLRGTSTFRWPSVETGLPSWSARTRSDRLLLVRAGNSYSVAAEKIVQVVTPGSPEWYLVSGLGSLLLAAALFYLSRRRQRRLQEDTSNGPMTGSSEESSAGPQVRRAAIVFSEADEAVAFLPEEDLDRPTPPLPQNIEVPGPLVEALKAGQAVLVLGPDASAAAGLPGSTELILEILQTAPQRLPPSLANVLRGPAPLAAAEKTIASLGGFSGTLEAIIAATGRDHVITSLRRIVEKAEPRDSLHPILEQLPWRAVVNLAYDPLAQRYFVARGTDPHAPMRVATAHDNVSLSMSQRSGERLLFEPMGDFERPATVALTLGELRRMLARAPEYQRALAGLLQSASFLFIGVDPVTIEQLIEAVSQEPDGQPARHFALVRQGPATDIRAATLGRFGVKMAGFDNDGAGTALVQFARRLRSASLAVGGGTYDAAPRYLLSSDRITSVKLQNIGPFADLALDLSSPEETGLQNWHVIFGGNGTGKSTILRAIALVLAGDHPRALEAGGRLLKQGEKEGLIELQFGSQTLRTRLTLDLSRVVVNSLQQTPVSMGTALALSFPALRGARTPEPSGPSRTSEPRDPDPADLVPLIAAQVDGRLADFKQWLVNTLVRNRDGDPQAARMVDLLQKLIQEMIPGRVDALVPIGSDFIIRVRTPDGDIPFDDLSQGMASIFNWVGLLVQRLYSVCDNVERPELEPAIVIIDEIEAHLHPEWQRLLVHLTKTHFPNLQLIASSHSPLLAGALKAHELIILEREEESGAVVPLRHSIDLYGLGSDDILTSLAFGLPSDRNPEVTGKTQEYMELIGRRSAADHRGRLTELASELRAFNVQLDPEGALSPAHLPQDATTQDMALFDQELARLAQVARPDEDEDDEPREVTA